MKGNWCITMGKDHVSHGGNSVCVKCGTCQTVCPVFSVRPDESSSARGKMALAEAVIQGHLDESDAYREYMEKCLLCGACEETCPNEVKTLSTMLGARERMAGNIGLKPGKKLVLQQIVGDPRLLDLVMRTGRTFQGILFKRIPSESGIRRRLPLPMTTPDRTMPSLARTFFTDRYSGKIVDGQGPRVGVFAGCMTNYLYPDMGVAMIKQLRDIESTVFVPDTQVCCGMPALAGGAVEAARELARQNVEAFEEYQLDAVVTGCASCGSNLKENYRRLLNEAGVPEERIERFLSKIYDINEFLYKHRQAHPEQTIEEKELKREALLKVTYHHPCHLGRLQGVKDEPIALIRSVPGVIYIPMAADQQCCGMGGSFSLEHYDIARDVNDQKVARITETGADAVVTSCPACIMHIRDGLIRNGRGDIQVLHIAELLERYGREGEGEERPQAAGSCTGVSGKG